ncbi:hypothetical protein ACWGKA_02445 [Streptomyces luteogriseus]
MIEEAMGRLIPYTRLEDASAAHATAVEQLDRSVGELMRLIEPHSGWDLVELLRVRNMPLAAAAGASTSEYDGLGAVIELVALLVATQEPAPATVTGSEHQDVASVIEAVQEAAMRCFHTGALVLLFRSLQTSDPLTRMSFASVMREVTLRNVAYPHMVLDTLQALFSDPSIERICRDALGFSAAEAVSVLEACNELRGEAWADRLISLHGASHVLMEVTRQRDAAHDAAAVAGVHDAAARARQATWDRPAEAAAFDAAALAHHTGLTIRVVEAVLEAFTLPVQSRDPREVTMSFLSTGSALRARPLLRGTGGRVLLVHDALALPAIRETIEENLKTTPGWAAYSKHRGAYLEETAVDLLGRHLPGATALAGFEHFVPASSSEASPRNPSQYTKVVEADALLIVDGIAIVVEAKAVALTPGARAGEGRHLRGNLRRIVTEAAHQAQRLRDCIEHDRGLRMRDGTWLDLSQISEVHTVAVSLEDLSGISTTTAQLAAAGLLPNGAYPWTVSVHDLRVIAELIDRPAELLVYLRRRTAAETTIKYQAVDELDLFLHFFQRGLYVEPDPASTAQELPQFGQPTVAAQRRRAAEHRGLVLSHTDQLDAWYFYRLGHSPTPASKPVMNADRKLLSFIDTITAIGAPGWLATSAILLEGSAKTQHQYGRAGEMVCKMSRRDGKEHTLALIGGTSQANSHLLIWMSRPQVLDHASAVDHLRSYLTAKKHQMHVARAAGFLLDASSGQLTDFLFDNRPVEPDPELDQLAEEMGLQAVTGLSRTLPPPQTRRTSR